MLSCGEAILAAGDSRLFSIMVIAAAMIQTVLMVIGVIYFGMLGVIACFGLGVIFSYPLLAWSAARYTAWFPRHDLRFTGTGLLLGSGAMWLHREAILNLI